MVKSEEQVGKMDPLLQFLFPFLIYEREGEIYQRCKAAKVNLRDINPQVKWNPMQSPNPLTDAQIMGQKATAYQTMQASGLFDAAMLSEEATKDLFPHRDAKQDEDDFGEDTEIPDDPMGIFEKVESQMPGVWQQLENRIKQNARRNKAA